MKNFNWPTHAANLNRQNELNHKQHYLSHEKLADQQNTLLGLMSETKPCKPSYIKKHM